MYEERCRRAGDNIRAAVALLDVAIAAMDCGCGGPRGAPPCAGPKCRLRPLALNSDGDCSGVRVVVQPAARTNRASVLRSCGLLWFRRLRDSPFDARHQPGFARPDAIGSLCRGR